MTAPRRTVHAPRAPAAVGAYSHAVAAGGLLFCSGQIGLDPASGDLVPGGAAAQTRRCLLNLGAVCDAAGASLADAVRVTLFLADLPRDWDAVNEAYEEAFAGVGEGSEEPPSRMALGAAALPRGALVAVDAVVALPGG
jgi:2-iminobutanoate/2-iminopropanoate deaminase